MSAVLVMGILSTKVLNLASQIHLPNLETGKPPNKTLHPVNNDPFLTYGCDRIFDEHNSHISAQVRYPIVWGINPKHAVKRRFSKSDNSRKDEKIGIHH